MDEHIPQNSLPKSSKEPWDEDCFGFGILLGSVLGFLSAVISIRMSFEMGKPDAFIREGWDYCHVASMIISGGIAGVVYAALLTVMTRAYKRSISRKGLFLFTLLLAVPVFWVSDYFAVTYRHAGYCSLGHLIVFSGSLGIAFLLLREKRPKL